MDNDQTSLRSRTRRAVQSEISESALELFLADGYEATTIERIAQAAGLSRRSFFRYFSGKDDVLAHTLSSTGAKLAQHVRETPLTVPAWSALRRGMQPMIERIAADPRSLPLTAMMLEGDALQATAAHRQREWLVELAQAVRPRLPEHLSPQGKTIAASALAGAALAALTAAELEWVRLQGKTSLEALLDAAMWSIVDEVGHADVTCR